MKIRSYDGLRTMRHRLAEWLDEASVAEPASSALVLGAHEAVANGIRHSGSAEPVTLVALVEDGSLVIEVADHGSWTALEDGHPGLGLEMIRQAARAVTIETADDGTTVRIVQPVESPQS